MSDPRKTVDPASRPPLPDADLLDMLADLDLVRCACGCGAVFDVAAYRARAAETGVRAFPPITTGRAA